MRRSCGSPTACGDRWSAWREGSSERSKQKLAARLQKAREAQARRSAPAVAEAGAAEKTTVGSESESSRSTRTRAGSRTCARLRFPSARSRTRRRGKPASAPVATRAGQVESRAARTPHRFRLPSTELLNEPPARSAFDEQELKDIAVRIKSKFEEFNVLGSVVQINPGPVVTTFEFKPEAGIKYSRITTLTEDLCLGLQAESILIERIPGKPTVGIEVPNTQREVISLRADSRIGRVSELRTRA